MISKDVALATINADAAAAAPAFVSRDGWRLIIRSVHAIVKRVARAAGVTSALSPH
jgi:site-specific recombinase XerC